MLNWAVHIAFVLLGIALLLCSYRVFVGPTTLDRAAAFGALSVNLVGLIAVLSIFNSSKAHFDLTILISLITYIGSAVVAKFVVRGVIIDRDAD